MNNKFELKFFKRNIGNPPDKNKTGIKSPLNRVKIAAPYAYVEVSLGNNNNYFDFDIFCKKKRYATADILMTSFLQTSLSEQYLLTQSKFVDQMALFTSHLF